MEIIIGAMAALLGLLFFTNSKKNTAEALLENQKTQGELNAVDKDISKNSGLLEAEEEKRKQLAEENEKNKKNDSQKDNLDYFNRK